MVRRAAAGWLVIAMLIAGAAPCAGWQASAQARHDCCVDGVCPDSIGELAGRGDVSQEAADRCCATSEEKNQHDRSQSAVVLFAVPPPTAIGLPPYVDAVHLRRPLLHAIPVARHAAPLYVLFSVFLV